MRYPNRDYLYYAYLSLYPVGNDEKFVKDQLEHYEHVLDVEKLNEIIEIIKIQKEFFDRCSEFGLTEKEMMRLSDIVRTVSAQKNQNSDLENKSTGKSL